MLARGVCTPPTAPTWTRRRCAQRCPHSPLAGTGWLNGWRLTFGGEDLGWEGALATVVEDPGEPGLRRALRRHRVRRARARRVGGRRPRPLPQDPAAGAHAGRATCSPGSTCSTRYEGGLPSAPLPRADRRRRRGGRRARRLRHRAALPPLPHRLLTASRPPRPRASGRARASAGAAVHRRPQGAAAGGVDDQVAVALQDEPGANCPTSSRSRRPAGSRCRGPGCRPIASAATAGWPQVQLDHSARCPGP